MLDTAREKKNIEKRERKAKNVKKSNSSNNIFFFTFTFLCGKIYIWWKTYLEKVSAYCYISITVFLTWQVIGNAVIKHQRQYRSTLGL